MRHTGFRKFSGCDVDDEALAASLETWNGSIPLVKGAGEVLFAYGRAKYQDDEARVVCRVASIAEEEFGRSAMGGVRTYLNYCLTMIGVRSGLGAEGENLPSGMFFLYLKKAILRDRELTEHAKKLWLVYIAARQFTISNEVSKKCIEDLLSEFSSYVSGRCCGWPYRKEGSSHEGVVELAGLQLRVVEYGTPRLVRSLKKALIDKKGYDITYQAFEHVSSIAPEVYKEHILRIS